MKKLFLVASLFGLLAGSVQATCACTARRGPPPTALYEVKVFNAVPPPGSNLA